MIQFKFLKHSFLVALAATVVSCSNNASEELTVENDVVEVMFNVSGIEDAASKPAIQTKSASVAKGQTEIYADHGEVQSIMSVESAASFAIHKQASAKVAQAGDYIGQTQSHLLPMKNGVKYRLIVFKKEEDNSLTYYKTAVGTVGTKLAVSLDNGTVIKPNKYTFTAITYNSTVAPVESSTTLPIPTDKDFLSASVEEISVRGGAVLDVPFDLVFKRQSAKVSIVLDTRGLPARITSIQAKLVGTIPVLNTAAFDVKTGLVGAALPGTLPSWFTAEAPIVFNAAATALDTDTLVASFYTVTPAPLVLNNFKVQITDLQLAYSVGGAAKTIFTSANPGLFSFPGLSLSQGKLINARISLMDTFKLGTVVWSKANLFLDTDGGYKFRDLPSTGYNMLNSDFWEWMVSLPGHNPSGAVEGVDPCTKVTIPSTGWVTPKEVDYDNLLDHSGNAAIRHIRSVDAVSSNRDYIEVINTNNQSIRFYTMGFYAGSSNGSDGTIGKFWASTPGTSGLAKSFYLGVTSTGINSGYQAAVANYSTLDSNNIRCVKYVN